MLKGTKIQKQSDLDITFLIQRLLSYPLVYPERLYRLKKAVIEDKRSIIDIVGKMSERQFLPHQIEQTLKVLITKLGSIENREELEKTLVESTESRDASIVASAGLDDIFDALTKLAILDEDRTDRRALDTLLAVWDTLFTSDTEPSQFVYALAINLPKIEVYFRNAKPTPGQVEYFFSAIDDVKQYLKETLHEEQSRKLIHLAENPDPERVIEALTILDSEKVQISPERIEFHHSVLWLLSDEKLLREKYIRVAKYLKAKDKDNKRKDPDDSNNPVKPNNLFPGRIDENQIEGPSLVSRLRSEEKKAENLYRLLQRPNGLELALDESQKKNRNSGSIIKRLYI